MHHPSFVLSWHHMRHSVACYMLECDVGVFGCIVGERHGCCLCVHMYRYNRCLRVLLQWLIDVSASKDLSHQGEITTNGGIPISTEHQVLSAPFLVKVKVELWVLTGQNLPGDSKHAVSDVFCLTSCFPWASGTPTMGTDSLALQHWHGYQRHLVPMTRWLGSHALISASSY